MVLRYLGWAIICVWDGYEGVMIGVLDWLKKGGDCTCNKIAIPRNDGCQSVVVVIDFINAVQIVWIQRW
jgi:hypothetical protein